MSKYLYDPREDVLRTDSGVGYYLEEDKREENENENWCKWGARVLDLCDLPVDEYMKPMTVNVAGGGGGGGDDTPSGSTKKYTLTYYVNRVQSKKFSNLEEGDLIPTYSVEEEGYDVTEWKDSNGDTYQTMPAKNLNLYCTKTIKSYTVRFIIDNEVVSTGTVNYNSYASAPSTQKTGYTFDGWVPSVSTTKITANTDFNGSYTVNSHTVTWSINGETTTETYNYGDTIVYPVVDVEGYTFVSWNGYQETMPDRNITITAVLTINSYNLIYNIESDGNTRLYSSASVVYNKAITQKPVPSQNGYSYTQWSGDEVYTNMPAHDVVYTTTETKNRYNIHYLVDGVEVNTIEYEYLAVVVKQPRYVKEGYDVTDWVGEPNTMPYNDVTATCVTTIKTFEVTIKDGSGNTIDTITVNYGTNVSDVMSGYPGYSYNGQTTTITEETTLTVTPNNYDVNVSIDGETYTVSLPYGSNIKEQVTEYLENTLTQEELRGHHVEVNVDDNATVSVGGNNITADLVPNEYTVVIDGYDNVEIPYGETILDKLPTVVLEEGEEFVGWFNGNEQITAETLMPDEDITLEPRTRTIERSVVVIVDGVSGESANYTYGTPISEIISNVDLGEKGEDEGYTVEWTVNGVPYNTGMTVGYDNISIECEFVPNDYVLSFFNGNTLISSANTPYKSIIGAYPEMAEIEGYNFVWSGEDLAGTEMPSHDVNVVGEYVEIVTANNFYYGFKLNSELTGSLTGITSGLTSLEIANYDAEAGLTVPVKSVSDYGQEIEDEWMELYEEDDEYTENWDTNYAYSIVMLVPTNKSFTGYRQGDKTGPNWRNNATYETNYGIVTIDGNDYNVYGFRNPRSGYIVSDTTAPKNIFIEIS